MMFICPNCGYHDAPCWKAHRYFLYVVYCRLDEMEPWNKELAEKLRQQNDLEEGPYTYHLTKSGYVLRVSTNLKDFLYRRRLIERYHVTTDPRQQKLATSSPGG